MSSLTASREAAIKNLETLATEQNIENLQSGPKGRVLEKVIFSKKAQDIISDTFAVAEHLQNSNACLTETEAYTFGRTINRLRNTLPNCTDATHEESSRKNLLLNVFRSSALAGIKNDIVLDKALLACGDFLRGQNQSLSRDITPVAQKLVEAALNTDQRINALSVLKQLVKQGESYQLALKAAIAEMKGSSQIGRRLALEILTELVKKGVGYDAAISAAAKGVSVPDALIQFASLDLMIALIEKGQGIKEALNTAAWTVNLEATVRWKSLDLYKALFNMGQGFDSQTLSGLDALHPSKSQFNTPDSEPDFLDLYKILVEKGHGYKTAIAYVENALRRCSDYSWWQINSNLRYKLVTSSLELLKALVDKGEAYDIAVVAAEQHLHTNTPAHYEAAVDVFKALFKQKQALDVGRRISTTDAQKNHWFQGYWDKKAFNEALEAEA